MALAASPIAAPSGPAGEPGEVFVLQDYRWVPVIVKRAPTEIDCSFTVVSGPPSVRAELVSEDEFAHFMRRRSYDTLESTPTGRAGRFDRMVETPGRYMIVIRNQRGALPAAVSLVVHTEVDPLSAGSPGDVSPGRRLIVILASLTFFSGTVLWSGRRLLDAYRRR